MKKLSLTLIIFTLAFTSSYGQNFDLRASFGLNVLQLTSDNETSLIDGVLHNQAISGRPGIQFGAAVTFGDRFYVQPGIQFYTLSTTIVNENSVTGNELKDETTLSAISVPLKFGFRLINPEDEDIFNVRIFGGFDGHHILSVNHSEKSGSTDNITTDDCNNLIVNADFGIGVDFLFLFLDTGYQLGLTPFHSGGDGAKSNAFYTNLGLRINF